MYTISRAWLSTGAAGAWHPPKFWTSPLAPAVFEVFNTSWHPQSSFYVTCGTLSFKFLTQALILGTVTFGPSANGDTPPPLRHADVLNEWSLTAFIQRDVTIWANLWLYNLKIHSTKNPRVLDKLLSSLLYREVERYILPQYYERFAEWFLTAVIR